MSVVNSARVSFDKESEWIYDKVPATIAWEDDCGNGGDLPYIIDGVQQYEILPETKRLSNADIKLIHYLAKHNHFTPFTHATVTFRWTVPIFMARQLLKHQIGLSVNEVSRRYVDSDPEFFMPENWRARHESAKQGSKVDEFVTEVVWENTAWQTQESLNVNDVVKRVYSECEWAYKLMIANNICPEQARMVLPQAMYTSYYQTGSLAAWARIYGLRNKPTAQLEHKVLMEQLDKKMSELYPVSWLALTTAE